nr:hypothetical protein [Candidatus Sigynarchaeum springense]
MTTSSENRKPIKTSILISTAITSLILCSGLIYSVRGEINESFSVEAGTSRVMDFFVIKGAVSPLEMDSNASISVYMMSQTNAGLFLANLSYTPALAFINYTTLRQDLDVTAIASMFGSYETEKNDSVHVYFAFENNGTNPVKVILRYQPRSILLDTLKDATKFMVLLFMVYLTVHLFLQSRETSKAENVEKSKVYKGFGYTFMFASINYFIDIFQSWWGRETFTPLYPDWKYRGMLFTFASFRVDQIVFLTLLLFSDLFMIYRIETVVGRKKRPIMTVLIAISIALNLLVFVVPGIFDLSFAFFAITLIITLIQIIWIYAVVMRGLAAKLRLKSVAILCGIMLPIVAGLLGGQMFPPNPAVSYIIANSLTISSVFFIKYGLE